jgi:hypothetical protein
MTIAELSILLGSQYLVFILARFALGALMTGEFREEYDYAIGNARFNKKYDRLAQGSYIKRLIKGR